MPPASHVIIMLKQERLLFFFLCAFLGSGVSPQTLTCDEITSSCVNVVFIPNDTPIFGMTLQNKGTLNCLYK